MEQGDYTMNHSEANDMKADLTEAAWDRLQKQLMTEPVNAQWVRWSKQANEPSNEITNEEYVNLGAIELNIAPNVTTFKLPTPLKAARSTGIWFDWMKRNRKWMSGAVAVSVLALTLLTPAGNQALAAILSKFRMEQVTVVQEDDVKQVMNGFFADGKSRDAVNKFGSFTQTSGTISGEYTLIDAEKILNRKLVLPKDIDLAKNNLYISPSNEITFNLHVDEINKALQRLGVKKLLPQSIDGKPIKLVFGEMVTISKQFNLNGLENNYSLAQTAVPIVDVDPSIPIEEALNAVLDIPFLPDNLKNNIKNAGALTDGSLPLPIVTNGSVEKRTIQGIEVVSTQINNRSESNTKNIVKNSYYNLTWVKSGRLYKLSGNGFTDPNAAFALAKELIQQ
jgi:hypothetical protein